MFEIVEEAREVLRNARHSCDNGEITREQYLEIREQVLVYVGAQAELLFV